MKNSLNGNYFNSAFIKLFFSITLCVLLQSCKKNNSCYDEQLYLQHKDHACTADCPGVIGCDGKTYCNECEANRLGIRIK